MYFIRSPIDSLDVVKKSGKKDNQTSRIRFITSCQSVRYHIFIIRLLSFRRSILHFVLMIHLYWKVHDERRITLGVIWIELIPSYQSHHLCHPWSFIFSRTLSIPFTNKSQSQKTQWRKKIKSVIVFIPSGHLDQFHLFYPLSVIFQHIHYTTFAGDWMRGKRERQKTKQKES